MSSLCRWALLAAGLSLAAALPGAFGDPKGPAPVRTDQDSDPLPAGALARLGSSRLRHGQPVYVVAFTPDGSALVSGGADGRIIFWEPGAGKELRRLNVPGPVRALVCSADGKHLFAGTALDGTVHMLEATTGKEVRRFQGRGAPVVSLALSPDGKLLVSAGQDAVVRLWDVASGKEPRQSTGLRGALALTFSPDGKHFASAGTDDGVRLWEVGGAQLVRRFPPGSGTAPPAGGRIQTIAFSPDGKARATGGLTRPVTLWDVATGKELGRLPDATRPARALAFTPDGQFLAVGHGDRTVRLWGLASGLELRRWEAPLNPGLAIAFSPDGTRLASAAQDSMVRVWDVSGDRDIHPHGGREAPIEALAFLPDGKRLVSADAGSGLRLWEAATGKELARLDQRFGSVSSLAAGADGQSVLATVTTTTPLAAVHVWRPGKGREARPLEGNPSSFLRQVLSPDGKTLAGFGQGYGIQLWDTATLKARPALKGDAAMVAGAVFSADGRLLAATAQDGRTRLWDTASGAEVQRVGHALPPLPPGPLPVVHLALAPDGRAFATHDLEVRVWEVVTGGERARFPRPSRGVSSLTFSPDGRLLLVGDGDGALVAHDLATGKEVGRLSGHRGAVHPVRFSLDGRLLATGSADSTVLVWDAVVLAKDLTAHAADLAPRDLANLWADLAGADVAKAHRAVWALRGAPAQAVPFLKERLRPAESEARRAARLIVDLDADAFTTREQASKELAALGRAVEPALKKALEGNPSAEARRRIQEILENLKEGTAHLDRAQGVRAVEVLEHVGSPEARGVLELLAKGDAEAPQTQQARLALERLAGRGR